MLYVLALAAIVIALFACVLPEQPTDLVKGSFDYLITLDGSSYEAMAQTGATTYAGTNASNIINSALDTADQSGVVRLMCDVTLTAPIEIESYTTLDATGCTVTLADDSDCQMIVDATGAHDFNVIGGTWNGNEANQGEVEGNPPYGWHLLEFHGAYSVKLTMMTTYNSSYDHLIFDDRCRDIVITGWLGDDGRGDGFNPLNCSNIIISDSIARNLPEDGFHVSWYCQNVTVSSCLAENCYVGGSFARCEYNKIIDSTFINCTYGGSVYANYYSQGCVFDGNLIVPRSYGFSLNGYGSITVINNRVYGGARGIHVGYGTGHNILNNVCTNFTDYGIVLTGGSPYGNHSVIGNVLTGSGTGIYVNNIGGNLIMNNVIAGVTTALNEAAGTNEKHDNMLKGVWTE